MTHAAEIAGRYIAVWNEVDLSQRQAMLAQDWAAGAEYVDPMMRASGRDEVAALIGAVHARFPGFRFALSGVADGYGDQVRFSWALGPETEPAMIMGTDFVHLEGNRIRSVTGFLDKVPQSGPAQDRS